MQVKFPNQCQAPHLYVEKNLRSTPSLQRAYRPDLSPGKVVNEHNQSYPSDSECYQFYN